MRGWQLPQLQMKGLHSVPEMNQQIDDGLFKMHSSNGLTHKMCAELHSNKWDQHQLGNNLFCLPPRLAVFSENELP